jgi:hypothetical protein
MTTAYQCLDLKILLENLPDELPIADPAVASDLAMPKKIESYAMQCIASSLLMSLRCWLKILQPICCWV